MVPRELKQIGWMWLAALVLSAIAVVCLTCCAALHPMGDAAGLLIKDPALIEQKIADAVHAALTVEQTTTGGRDVNEPWTARILAMGYPLAVVAVYIISRRFKTARMLIDWAKGKPSGKAG